MILPMRFFWSHAGLIHVVLSLVLGLQVSQSNSKAECPMKTFPPMLLLAPTQFLLLGLRHLQEMLFSCLAHKWREHRQPTDFWAKPSARLIKRGCFLPLSLYKLGRPMPI